MKNVSAIIAAIVFASLCTAHTAQAATPSAVARAYGEYSAEHVAAYRRFLAREHKELLEVRAVAVRKHRPAALLSFLQTMADADVQIFEATNAYLTIEITEEVELQWTTLVTGVEGTKADALRQVRALLQAGETAQNGAEATQTNERL